MQRRTADKPNVIWIFGDQHRAQAQGHLGNPNLSTPNIDRLAGEGLVFSRAVSGNPWCTPFRASLLTGRYPHHTCYRTPQLLEPSIPTIAAPFRQAGYDTAFFGKWHLGGWDEGRSRSALHVIPKPQRGGFDAWIGYENNNSQYDCYVHGHDAHGQEIPLYKLPGYETDALTDLLIDYLLKREAGSDEKAGGGRQGKPFFAVLSVQPPHGPYVAPAEFMARHRPAEIELRPNVPPVHWVRERAMRDLAGYYAQIENLDWNLGRIREAIARAALTDNTYIWFFSDHGDMHGCHGLFGKSQPWEEAIRIPCILGGGVPYYDGARAGRFEPVLNHVDFAPTTLGLCGLDAPAEMVGFDYSAYRLSRDPVPLSGEPDSAFLQHIVRKMHADGIDRTWRGIVTRDNWKYVSFENMPFGLYNLNEDPYELANLAHNPRFAAEHRRLRDRLDQWISQTGDSFPLAPP